jgi:large-conductance mechanosensitive channel
MSKSYTLDQIILHILQNLSINQIVIWIGVIIFLVYVSIYMNITLLQFMLIGIVVFLIIYMSQLKDMEIEKLQQDNDLKTTNNMSLLKFVDDISYFKKYSESSKFFLVFP